MKTRVHFFHYHQLDRIIKNVENSSTSKGLEGIQTRSFGTYLVVTFKGQLAFQVIPLIAPRASPPSLKGEREGVL